MSDGPYAGLAVQGHGAVWRRWRMASFDEPEPVVVEPAPAPPEPQPDPEAIRQQARAEGYAQGLAEGREQGHREGLCAGHTEGLAQGREQGYEEGYEAGLAQGREQARQEALRLEQLAGACAASLAALEEAVGQGLITLALDIARQVVRTTLVEQPGEVIAAAVRDVLRVEAPDGARLTLWVHPDDVDLVRLHLADELAEGRWRVMADPALARGGCRAESAYGTIDATLQTRWRRVAASLGRNDPWEDAR